MLAGESENHEGKNNGYTDGCRNHVLEVVVRFFFAGNGDYYYATRVFTTVHGCDQTYSSSVTLSLDQPQCSTVYCSNRTLMPSDRLLIATPQQFFRCNSSIEYVYALVTINS